jgi:endonuclease III
MIYQGVGARPLSICIQSAAARPAVAVDTNPAGRANNIALSSRKASSKTPAARQLLLHQKARPHFGQEKKEEEKEGGCSLHSLCSEFPPVPPTAI